MTGARSKRGSMPPEFHHRGRRLGHPRHPCLLDAPECAADHRHVRLARLDCRAVEDHRALTNPMANGGTVSDAFHVVFPSMPGYGFSVKPTSHQSEKQEADPG